MTTEEKLEPADSKSQVQITRVLALLAPMSLLKHTETSMRCSEKVWF